jgi:hypothetical protein
MAIFSIVGKGIVKQVKKSRSGNNVVVIPEDWKCSHVRIYQLEEIKINGK